jgi:hypothetical protein
MNDVIQFLGNSTENGHGVPEVIAKAPIPESMKPAEVVNAIRELTSDVVEFREEALKEVA